MKKSTWISLTILISFHFAHAQDEVVHFTQKQLLDFETQAKSRVRSFCFYLGDLASSGTKEEDRGTLKTELRNLFIADTVRIDVLAKSHKKKPYHYSVSEYINIVAGYHQRFTFVVMQFYKVRVDVQHLKAIERDGKTIYMGTFSYWQSFIASNVEKESNTYTIDDLKANSDDTPKEGVFYLIPTVTKSNASGKRWMILLGSIKTREDNYKPM